MPIDTNMPNMSENADSALDDMFRVVISTGLYGCAVAEAAMPVVIKAEANKGVRVLS